MFQYFYKIIKIIQAKKCFLKLVTFIIVKKRIVHKKRDEVLEKWMKVAS